MKKNIVIACSTAVCITLLSIAGYATTSMNEAVITPIQPGNAELQSALDSSGVLKSRYNIESTETIDNDNIDSMNVTADIIPSVSVDNAVKVYNVEISDEAQAISQQINKENDYWMIPQVINEKMSFIYMKKGDDIKTAARKINNVNVSEARKEKMLARASERAGKWYVTRIETQRNSNTATAFISQNAVNSISGVTQKEYIYITNTNTLAVWAKTEAAEYIIPYTSDNSASKYSNNTAYSVAEISDLIAQ